MLIISTRRLLMTTALTLPMAAVWVPVHAQDQNACAELEQFLEQDMPEGMGQTEEELSQILEDADPEQCAVANIEIERAMQGQSDDTAQAQDQQQAQEETSAEETGQLVEQESTRIELSDEVVVEGEVFIDQQQPEVDVDTGQTEVVVQDPQPRITLSGQAPEILVREAPSNIVVEMQAPTIRIEQQPPEIIVTMPPPGVEVADARPQVEVRQSEPTVSVRQTTPTVDLQLRQAENPEDSQGVSVRDRASGETMMQGETREAADAQVNLTRNDPVITYEESEEGDQQANFQDQRGRPTVRYETSEPQIEFSQAGEPQVEVTRAGEPTVSFRESGEESDQAANQTGQEDQQQLADQQQPSDDTAQDMQMAQGEQLDDEAQQPTEGEQAQEDDQAQAGAAEEPVELSDAEIERAEGQDQAPQADQQQTAGMAEDQRPDVQYEGYEMVEASQVDAETLTGHTVFDVNNQDVGEVGDIVLSADGQVEGVIIDVGGFLGLGQKPVRIDFEQLAMLREQGGEQLRLYVDATEEELTNMERYSE